MDLPKETHPSRLYPQFLRWYIASGIGVVLIAALITLASPYLDIIPFPYYYLYALSLLPLFKAAAVDRERKHHEYIFESDRVIVKEGIRTIEQEDVPYDKITDVSSTSTPTEKSLNVGDLTCHIAGRNKDLHILGLKDPQQYEDLILTGGEDEQTGQGSGSGTSVDELRQRLDQLEQQYNNGDIGRAEYERNYYYYKGQLDLLEEQQ